MGGRLERADELGIVRDLRADDPDRQLPFDPGEPGREHGAVPAGPQALTEAVAPQWPARGLVEEQRRIVGEDPALQLLEGRGRLEAELLGQRRPVDLEGPEGVGVAPTAIEGDHELGPEGFSSRVLGGQGVQLRDELRRPAAGQLGVHQGLVRDHPELADPLGLRSGPVLIGELRIGLALPEVEGGPGFGRRLGGIVPAQTGARRGQSGLETGDVERFGRQPEQVPG